jgi:hypothetical protein
MKSDRRTSVQISPRRRRSDREISLRDRRSRPRPGAGRFKESCDAAYRVLRKYGAATAFVLFMLNAVYIGGCLKIPAKGATPGRQATPLENVLAYNAVLAQTNQYVAEGVIEINQASPSLLDTNKANTILTAQSKIADADRQLTAILRTAGNTTPDAGAAILKANAPRIRNLIAEIQKAGQNMISSGEIGVKNPISKQTFTADFQEMMQLVTKVLDTLISAQLIK